MQVYTKKATVLVASIMCVSCRDNNQFIVSNSQVIKLVGGCTDCPWLDTVYRWTVTRKDGVALPINLATTTTGGQRRNLVVRSSIIEAGFAYRSVDRLFRVYTESFQHRTHCTHSTPNIRMVVVFKTLFRVNENSKLEGVCPRLSPDKVSVSGRPGVPNARKSGGDVEFWHAWRLASTGRRKVNSSASLYAYKLLPWHPGSLNTHRPMSHTQQHSMFILIQAFSTCNLVASWFAFRPTYRPLLL